jgi:hypothetical protein
MKPEDLAIRRHGPWDLRGRVGKRYGWADLELRPSNIIDVKG